MCAAAACGFLATPAQAFDITMCGQSVPPGEVGVLTTDLSCPVTASAVNLTNATLDMQGHTITGGAPAVVCSAHCTILSSGGTPGTITGTAAAIQLDLGASISDVRLIGNMPTAGIGISYERTRVQLTNVVITDFYQAVGAGGKIIGTNVHVSGCVGSPCIFARRNIRLDGLIATHNMGCCEVLYSNRVHLINTSLTDNEATGISAHGVRLRDSTVTGNGPGGTGIDIDSDLRPRLANSTCGVSHMRSGAGTWGVCTND